MYFANKIYSIFRKILKFLAKSLIFSLLFLTFLFDNNIKNVSWFFFWKTLNFEKPQFSWCKNTFLHRKTSFLLLKSFPCWAPSPYILYLPVSHSNTLLLQMQGFPVQKCIWCKNVFLQRIHFCTTKFTQNVQHQEKLRLSSDRDHAKCSAISEKSG